MIGWTDEGGPRVATWRVVVWGGAAALLALPAVAMRFTPEVTWTASDFAVFGAMLLVAGGVVEGALRASGRFGYRAGAAIAAGTGFLLLWVNLAVGVIGREDNPLNWLPIGVLAVAAVGAAMARFRAAGMARAMAAAAVAQALVAVVAQSEGYGIWLVTAVFCALWLSSAALFAFVRR